MLKFSSGTKGRRFESSQARHSSFFGPIEDQIKRLSVSGIKSCGVYGAVRNNHFEQSGFFGRIPLKVKKMRLISEF